LVSGEDRGAAFHAAGRCGPALCGGGDCSDWERADRRPTCCRPAWFTIGRFPAGGCARRADWLAIQPQVYLAPSDGKFKPFQHSR